MSLVIKSSLVTDRDFKKPSRACSIHPTLGPFTSCGLVFCSVVMSLIIIEILLGVEKTLNFLNLISFSLIHF